MMVKNINLIIWHLVNFSDGPHQGKELASQEMASLWWEAEIQDLLFLKKLRFSCWEHFFQNNSLERTFSDRCFKIFAYFKFQVFHFPGSSAALLIGQKRLTRDFPAFLSVLNLHVRHDNCLNINILYIHFHELGTNLLISLLSYWLHLHSRGYH